mgnify:FL=1|tara:strand:+ start:14 stop:592 length:579 start_codon:yes stop_codon:yes gene_type:complete
MTPLEREYKKQYYLNNKEKIIKTRMQFYFNGGGKEQQRKYYFDNIEKIKERKRQHYLYRGGKERRKQYDIKNREERNKRVMKKYHSNPNIKLSMNIRRRINSALKGKNKSKQTLELLGCSVKKIWEHLESKFKPGMTKENHGKWHIDHIRPCASFDLTDQNQQAICFHYTNLQPLWAVDNIKKRDKLNYEVE